MIRELPIWISAWMIFPSGPADDDFSSAPSAFLYHSIACAVLSRMRCGVTVWKPSGTGLFALAIASSFVDYRASHSARDARFHQPDADRTAAVECPGSRFADGS